MMPLLSLSGVEACYTLRGPRKVEDNGALYERQCKLRQRVVDAMLKKRREKEDAEMEEIYAARQVSHTCLLVQIVAALAPGR